MRIITGTLKGRNIPFNIKKYDHARITSGRVKEAAFNMLGSNLDNLHFLDLFAGSGQIGLEAYSRDAQVVLNEPDRNRHLFIAGLLKTWALKKDRIRLLNQKAEKLLPRLEKENQQFDLVYLDPPYHLQLDGDPFVQAILNRIGQTTLVTPGGILLAQHPASLALPDTIGHLSMQSRKIYGDNVLSVYKSTASP